MIISQMIKREDFYKILRETVIAYFRDVHKKDVEFSYNKASGYQKLYVNETLGFISAYPAPKGLRKFLLGEYNIRSSKLKRLVGKAVALGASKFPQLQVGKGRRAYITDGVIGKNTFIYPQNRSVRFFDYDSLTVDCIVKSGFSDKYFKNQLEFRKANHYDFMVELIDFGDNWFREPILHGHPLARITDAQLYEKATKDALSYMKIICEDSLMYRDAPEYADELRQRTETLLNAVRERKSISTLEKTEELLRNALSVLSGSQINIPLCKSHGDFQSGNIWVDDNGKTFIYDWETVGIRSAWYDSAVLNYSIRREFGWGDLLGEPTPELVLDCDTRKNYSVDEYKTIKSTIMVEDILFYLEDMLELPENWGGEIYDNFIQRMADLTAK